MENLAIKTIKVGITHTGAETVVVYTADGTITVRAGAKMKDQDILPLNERQIDLYKSKGVKFSGLPKTEEEPADSASSLQKAVEAAKAKHAEAVAASQRQGSGDPEKKALKDAVDELTAAEKALAEARK